METYKWNIFYARSWYKKVQYLVGSTESLFYSPVSVICFKKNSQFKTNTYNKNTTANITRFELHPYENKTVTYTLQFPRLKNSSQLTSMGEQKHFSRCPQHLIRVSNIYQTEWPHQILKMAIISWLFHHSGKTKAHFKITDYILK